MKRRKWSVKEAGNRKKEKGFLLYKKSAVSPEGEIKLCGRKAYVVIIMSCTAVQYERLYTTLLGEV